MTTGTNPDVNPVARRWAARHLKVPENASRAETRRAYLKKLRDGDFLPPSAVRHAFRILDGKNGAAQGDEEWLVEEEGRLRAAVESFAAEFFTLSATERREHWQALLFRCETVPPLTARLRALEAGLDLETEGLPSGQSQQGLLAEQLLHSFPLAPMAQAASRQAFLREIEEPSAADHRLWEKAAKYLLAEWPALAALDYELIQHVAKLRSRLKRKRTMHQRSQRQPPAPVAGGKKGNPWWLLLIVFGMVSGLVRSLTTSNNSTPSVTPSPIYSPESSLHSVLSQQPLIDELFDPSKFDVEIEGPIPGFTPRIEGQAPSRILRFTPRPSSTITGPNGPQANNGQPLYYGEAILRLRGVSQEQMNTLFVRAATTAKKRLDAVPKSPPQEGKPIMLPWPGVPKTPPEKVEPKPPKSPQGDGTRP
jgi:hypothetical protein